MNLDETMNEDRADVPVTIETDAGTLVAVHGYLALALRHPDALLRPSADIAAKFARAILQASIDAGLFTARGVQLIAADVNTPDHVIPESLQVLRKGGHA